MRNFVLFTLLATVFFMQPACSQHSSASLAEAHLDLPKWNHSFGVGRQFINLIDPSRSEKRGHRELAVWVYYPTKSIEPKEFELVLPQSEWRTHYRPFLEKKLGIPAAKALTELTTRARTDAPGAVTPGGFPVLLFAPGAGWLPTDYSSIIEDLVSRGFVVLAFASEPLSPVVQITDGRLLEGGKVSESTYGLVGADFLFLRGQLEALNQNPHLHIKGNLDLSKIGTFGHSIGGAAAVLAAARDEKIRASINLDGDFAGDALYATAGTPVLYVTTEPPQVDGAPIEKWDEDQSETRRKNVWAKIHAFTQAAVRVRIAHMFHSNFQDAALLPPTSMPENLRRSRFGSIEGSRGLTITTELIARFFETHLNGGSGSEFLSLEQKFTETRFEAK